MWAGVVWAGVMWVGVVWVGVGEPLVVGCCLASWLAAGPARKNWSGRLVGEKGLLLPPLWVTDVWAVLSSAPSPSPFYLSFHDGLTNS